MNSLKPVCHRDGTVTYWSVYRQSWERRAPSLPLRELVAMAKSERSRIFRHLLAAAAGRLDLQHPGGEP